jgi:hypothetical protein
MRACRVEAEHRHARVLPATCMPSRDARRSDLERMRRTAIALAETSHDGVHLAPSACRRGRRETYRIALRLSIKLTARRFATCVTRSAGTCRTWAVRRAAWHRRGRMRACRVEAESEHDAAGHIGNRASESSASTSFHTFEVRRIGSDGLCRRHMSHRVSK